MKSRFSLAPVALLLAAAAAAGEDKPKPPPLPDVPATRQVCAAVLEAGKANARAARPVTGDALTELYVRAAAVEARRLPQADAVPAFLAALGVTLDDSDLIRGNLLVGPFCKKVESDDERKARLAVLGTPTVWKHHDWCQHFAVSCMLTALGGPVAAEAAGLLKERLDMRPGGSGFSFADLSADLSGIAFAVRLQGGGLALEKVADGFRVKDYVPDPDDLSDGLTTAEFKKQYGSFDDDRYKEEVARIRKRIAALPGQKDR
jgi:uncharacterized protein YfiM (DUF2279 family)